MLYPKDLSTVWVLLQSTYGLLSFITPASALLFVGLSYTDVKYKDWFKFIWKFLIIMLALIVAIALIIKYIINIGKYNIHTTNLNNYVLKY